MNTTILLLASLDTKDEKQLAAFVEQLKKDVRLVSPTKFDVLRFAENLLAAVLKIAQNGELVDPAALRQKLLEVFDSLPEEQTRGSDGSTIYGLYSCLDTFAHQHAHEIAKDLIGYRMLRIIKANGDAKILKEESRELTELLEKNFAANEDVSSQMTILLKESPRFEDYRKVALPRLTKAVNALMKLQRKHKNENEFDPGIVFTLNQLNARAAEIKEDVLKAKASKIIEEMKENCEDCKTHLKQTILKAITKNATHQSTYGTDVKSFVNDFIEEENPLNLLEDTELSSSVSEEVRIAVHCYHATNILHTKLTDAQNEPNPITRLKNAEHFYRHPDIQKTFKSNPDWKVVQFFKKIGYLFGQLFTVGYGYFFMLPQAKLHKLTDELFHVASKRGVLPSPGLVN